jgi:hypothetical protein
VALSPELAAAIRGLQAELSRISGRLTTVEANQRADQVTNASVENGSITFNDSAGNAQVVLGLQPDGTFAHASVTSTTPVAPDAPLTGPGVLSCMVTWDGGMSDGSAPLADFAGVQVHLSAASGFTPDSSTLQGTMGGAGTFGVGGLAAGTTYYAALVAYNTAGNASPAGAQTAVVPQSVPANIPPGAISALQLQTGSITAAQLAANAGILGQQIAGQTITGANIAAGTITANLVAAGIVIAGVIDGTMVSAPVINGGTINGATFTGTNWIENLAGSFYYSGPPGVGDLIASVTDASSDPLGNVTTPGIASYEEDNWVSLYNAQLNFLGGAFVTLFNGDLTLGGAPLAFQSPVDGAFAQVEPGTAFTPETWHSLGTAGSTGCTLLEGRYALSADGNFTVIDVALEAGSGGSTAGTYTWSVTLPDAYQFPGAFLRNYALPFNAPVTTATQDSVIVVDGSGTGSPGRVRITIPAVAANVFFTGTCLVPIT